MNGVAHKGSSVENAFTRSSLLTWLVIFVAAIWQIPVTWAGPPLAMDDPGVLEPGSWEIIAAVSGEKRSTGNVLDVPLLDVSLGLTRSTQLSVSTSFKAIDPEGADNASGLDVSTIAYKWQLVSTDKWEMALAANYGFVLSHELIPEGTSNDVRTLGLPVLVSYSAGSWTWYGQAGWSIDSDNNRNWDLGIGISHPLLDSTEWMMEIGSTSARSFDDHSLFFNLGLDHQLGPEMHLLVSVGSRLGAGPEANDQLDVSFFAGLQWFK